MGGSSNRNTQPFGASPYAAPPPLQKANVIKAGGNEAGMEEPPTSAPPGMQPAPGMAPPAQGAPGQQNYFNDPLYGGIRNFSTNPVGSAGINLQMPGGYTGTPFRQEYGGQPAPYDNLHAQIRDAFNNYSTGAGRFGSNNAARYTNFAGGSFWSPDSGNYNLGRRWEGQQGPFQTPQYNPRSPMGQHPMSFNQPPQGMPQGAPQGQPRAAQGPDHSANFQRLLQQDPSGRLAAGYTQYGGARDWLQQNQNKVGGMVPGGFGAWRQQYGGGNRFLEGNEEQNLMRMAGLGV